MRTFSRGHEPEVGGGIVAAFLAVVLASGAAFLAISAGAFERAPRARMMLLMPLGESSAQHSLCNKPSATRLVKCKPEDADAEKNVSNL